jgi:hemerythrin-like domain-containing protein
MSTLDFRTAAAGFDQPIELWNACHERVTRMCNLLQRLVVHMRTAGADENARTTAVSIRRYFDEAAPRHHEDEEIDLFPRLIARLAERKDDGEAQRAVRAIETMTADHQAMDQLWQVLRAGLIAVENGTGDQLAEAEVTLFVDRYRTHIALEDSVIAPALRKRLKRSDLEAVGRAMAARRGVAWETLVPTRSA